MGRGVEAMKDPDSKEDRLSEWRWRTYCDHLADLGYDLEGGTHDDREPEPVHAGRNGPLSPVS